MKQMYFVALAGALVLNAGANLMMKFGMERLKASGISMEHGFAALAGAILTNWILILGLFCFAVNVGLYTFALKGLPISVAYPIMATVGFAIIVTVAGIYLGERLSPIQWVGVACILVGVWLVGSRANVQLSESPQPPAASRTAG